LHVTPTWPDAWGLVENEVGMTENPAIKRSIRERMQATGEKYTTARRAVLQSGPQLRPAPASYARPTVITRFLGCVVRELEQRNARGAAVNTWKVAARFEPPGRAWQDEAEAQRLLLLADRIARKWVPATAAALRQNGLSELANFPRIAAARDAADATERLGGLRQLINQVGSGPGPASPQAVGKALAEMQLALRHTGRLDHRITETAVVMVPHAAKGLVGAFFADASIEGIPAETAATVAVLDSLDEEHVFGWGQTAPERTIRGDAIHRALVESLVNTLSRGGQVTNAVGARSLPEPPLVGRYRPDVSGRDADGQGFIGVAKLGPELLDIRTQEQLRDFSTFAPDGHRVAFHLAVPQGWRARAGRAIRQAGAEVDSSVSIHEVSGTDGGATPPDSG